MADAPAHLPASTVRLLGDEGRSFEREPVSLDAGVSGRTQYIHQSRRQLDVRPCIGGVIRDVVHLVGVTPQIVELFRRPLCESEPPLSRSCAGRL